MRNLLLLLIIGLGAYGGYTYWNTHRQTVPPAQVADAKIEEPAAVVKAEPAPAPAPTKVEPERPKAEPERPAPVVPSRRLAPEGTFFVLQRLSIPTETGITSIAPGTKVTVVRTGPPLHLSDGKVEFDASPEQVTNDIDLATQVYNANLRQQVQTASVSQATAQMSQTQRDEQSRANAEKGEADTRRAQAMFALRARLPALINREAAMRKTSAEIRAAYGSRGNITYNGSHPRLVDVDHAEWELTQASEERRNLENRIMDLQK